MPNPLLAIATSAADPSADEGALAKLPPPKLADAAEVFLPARRVWERYGVTDMTIYRWLRNERMGFP